MALTAIISSLVAVLSSHSAKGNVVRSSFPCPAVMGDMLFDSTINRTTCSSMRVYRSNCKGSRVAHVGAMERTSITTSPVSVRLVQVQVQVPSPREVESLVAGRVERFIQASPHKRKPISAPNSAVLLSSPLSLSFTAHFPAASPTHKPKYLPPLPFAIGRSIYAYIYRRASGLRS